MSAAENDVAGAPVVETSGGALRGTREDGLAVFRGVPYAAPPVGELRFRSARPHPGWAGVRDASAYGPSAPQPVGHPVLGDHGRPPFDEDCLTLNVWTPAPDGARRPVLVWIHGGGFLSGSGTLPYYAGDTFARDGDLVVVTISYRIGALGYLYLGDEDSTNVWLTDQLAALRWVHENIAAFGGDPDNVTVAGQSGGAFSTAALAVHPEGGPLFRRMILQSPPFGLTLPTPDESLATTELFVRAADAGSVEKLRELPYERLIEATFGMFAAPAPWATWRVPFLPVADGRLLVGNPLDTLVGGAAATTDLMLGWTRDEATFALVLEPQYADPDPALVRERFAGAFGERADAAYAHYTETTSGGLGAVVTDLLGDELFRIPCSTLAEARATAENPAWVYQFDYATPAYDGRLGATHCLELPFTFHNADRWSQAPFLAGADPKTVADLGAAMHRAWIAFVRTGDPSAPGDTGLPDWPRYTTDGRTTMRFDATSHAAPDELGDRRALFGV
ncbi:carboxylesterase/lipase family protein [Yinghuangia seranimata]|uniref:carboxylesterase/lipase family protein n=1 Tax=Yinghuangia seranimata TaxID=408067 RepID=UPI00248CBE6C|nr:carboxylesterase family protein [Yinghuangia seranimata]MDI2129967.1 carboxylesterase family protein [Yinghuangia seranimata]MDI2131645.1 carboxylesterase family protein [Yinghuangia seranimata]